MNVPITLSGQFTLPQTVVKKLRLKKGDGFEVKVEGDDLITLRRVRKNPKSLFELLSECPGPLEIPPRSREMPRQPIDFNSK